MIGSRVGNIRVTGVLGQGGMGDVYRGVDERLDRPVALKVIRADRRPSGESRARFIREARALSSLDHPNICRIYEYIERPEGDFLILELIDGVTLDEAVKQGMSRARKLRVATEIAGALAAAHRKGIVHRDLKAQNVMITPAGTAKILDFGVARTQAQAGQEERGEEAAPTEPVEQARTLLYPVSSDHGTPPDVPAAVTVAGMRVGTPATMSPEQARGATATAATDMYSFGLLVQEMFSEKPVHPEDLSVNELLIRASRGVSEPMTGQPRDLTLLVNRLKSVAPADRPTAVETLQLLLAIEEAPRRRVRYAVAALLLLAVIAAAIKYVADVTAARREAERQRRQAEELVSFIVGDLRTKLEGVGRLDVLDDAATRALTYFQAVRPEDLSGDDLNRHARALAQLGEVRMQQGKLDEAVKLFGQSERFASAGVARDPSRDDWQLTLSNAHFWLGDALRRKDDPAGALVHFRRYLDIARQLAARHPGDGKYETEVGYGHANLGGVYEATGDLDTALREYQTAVALVRRRLARDPNNGPWQDDLAASLNLLGALLQKRNQLAAAEAVLEEEVAVRRRLLAAEPNDARRIRNLATTLAYFGQLQSKRNNPESAKAAYREELALSTRLASLDPSNLSARRNQAAAESRLAELMTDDVQGGLAMIGRAIATFESLVAADDRPGWRRDLQNARQRQAALRQLAAGHKRPPHG